MVLLDYIANKGVRLPREGSSTRRCGRACAPRPSKVGVGAVFPPATR